MINAALAGVLVATILLLFGSGIAAVVAGVVTFAIAIACAVYWLTRAMASTVRRSSSNFPTPALRRPSGGLTLGPDMERARRCRRAREVAVEGDSS